MNQFNITFAHSNFPWKRKSDEKNENHLLLTSENKVIFTISSGIYGEHESEANLALIQRAPEMAHLLADILHQLSTDLDLDSVTGCEKYKYLEGRIRTLLAYDGGGRVHAGKK